MKRICLILLVLISGLSQAQVGVGTATPSNAAMLEVDGGNATSGYRGFMPPRVPTQTERDLIAPAVTDDGLMVFVIDTGCLDLWTGTAWESINCLNGPSEVWINEFHYDNTGTDTNGFIEVAGVAGTDLSNYYIALYNGENGSNYGSLLLLSGIIDNEQNGFGAVGFLRNNIQNGVGGANMEGDGIMLIGPNNQIIQFLSYEGIISSSNGPGAGQTSDDIGVSEGGTTLDSESLQLVSPGATTGTLYSDFIWQAPAGASFDTINVGQNF